MILHQFFQYEDPGYWETGSLNNNLPLGQQKYLCIRSCYLEPEEVTTLPNFRNPPNKYVMMPYMCIKNDYNFHKNDQLLLIWVLLMNKSKIIMMPKKC